MNGRAKIDFCKFPLSIELLTECIEQFRCVQREDRLLPNFVFHESVLHGIPWEEKDVLVECSNPIVGLHTIRQSILQAVRFQWPLVAKPNLFFLSIWLTDNPIIWAMGSKDTISEFKVKTRTFVSRDQYFSGFVLEVCDQNTCAPQSRFKQIRPI